MAGVIDRRARLPLVALLAAVFIGAADDQRLGRPQAIAEGVRMYRLDDQHLVDPPAPIAVRLLRLDPAKIELRSALALDKVLGTETVLDIARRHRAIAAVNAGFFAPSGDPAGLLKVDGELVSEMTRPRGAVAILTRRGGSPSLLFDRVTVEVTVRFDPGDGEPIVMAASLDTTRSRDHLTVYTPRYHDDTDTSEGGVEWVLRGRPLKVVDRRDGVGRTPIPRDGLVLSYGGRAPPALEQLAAGQVVHVVPRFTTRMGTDSGRWQGARDIVGGAGLLVLDGRPVRDWAVEDLRPGFDVERHPRTMIGVDRGGDIWLAAIDGRQPGHSVGMNFRELQGLAARVRLRQALNLDGGGSTTLVVRDAIVNRPSDPQGPRKVSDALLVMPRVRGR